MCRSLPTARSTPVRTVLAKVSSSIFFILRERFGRFDGSLGKDGPVVSVKSSQLFSKRGECIGRSASELASMFWRMVLHFLLPCYHGKSPR